MALKDVGAGAEEVFYAALFLFMFVIFLFGIRGFLLKRSAKADGGEKEELNYHFLAGSTFGPMVMCLLFCGIAVGGIVMVATPNDVRNSGYVMLMWISGCSWCGGAFNIFGPRIREVMRGRNYLSPNDFLIDRYRSSWISTLGVLSSTFQMVMITGLEWLCLKLVFVALFGDGADHESWLWGIGIFIWICECLGGMASVALTDTIQAGLLVFAFFTLPIFVESEWGGFKGIGGVNCENRNVADSFGKVGAMGLGSPWDLYGTDACYQNVAEDTANSCAMRLSDIIPNSQASSEVALPLSFIAFAVSAAVPPWKNINHTFGVKTAAEEAMGARYQEVCKFNANCIDPLNATTCAITTSACPPTGTTFTTFSANPLNAAHNQLYVNCTGTGTGNEECRYLPKAIAARANHTYSGYLTFADGTTAYTAERMSSTQSGCVSINRASFWHFKYPPRELALQMLGFGFMMLPFAFSPLSLHYVMAAKDTDALRASLSWLHVFPLVFFLPVILLGATAGAVWPVDSTYAFPLVALEIAKTSSFGAFLSVICLIACIASFMSTADSVMICCSLLFTVDLYKNLWRKDKVAAGQLMVVAKLASLATIVTGISIALYTDVDFIEMLWIGNGMLGNLVPVYLGLFFHELQSFEVFVAMVVNLLTVLTFQAIRWYPLVDCPVTVCAERGLLGPYRARPALPAPLGHGDPAERYLWLLPPFYGTCASAATLLLGRALRRRESLDRALRLAQEWFDRVQGVDVCVLVRFGAERLDLDREGAIVAGLMRGVREPLHVLQSKHSKFGLLLLAAPFAAPLALPFWEREYDPVDEVGGLPKWAFDFTVVNFIATGCLIVTTVYFWKGKPAHRTVSISQVAPAAKTIAKGPPKPS